MWKHQLARRVAKWRRTRLSAAALLAATGILLLAPGSAGAAASGTALTVATGTSTGELTGTVSITGAPKGFSGLVGVGACPAPIRKGEICASPQYTLSSNGGTYTLALRPGSWFAVGFYELAAFGGAFLGKSKMVTITAATTVHRNFTIPYTAPGTVRGNVSVKGVPKGVTVSSESVLACPANVPYTGGNTPIVCVNTQVRPTGEAYSIQTLPPGKWLLYPGYTTIYGPFISADGRTVTITSGAVTKRDLVVRYHTPDQGMMTGTVSVTGAPKGFSGLVGIGACPAPTPTGTICSSPQYALASGSGAYTLLLSRGSWVAEGFYELTAFGGAFLGKSKMVTIAGGTTVQRNFTIPYKAPGTVTGRVKVEKVPSGVTIQATLVLACPSADPYTNKTVPIVCVEMSAPPRSAYSISTLPPGSWLLYPGYAVTTGSYLSHHGVAATVTSNHVTTQNLTVIYKSG